MQVFNVEVLEVGNKVIVLSTAAPGLIKSRTSLQLVPERELVFVDRRRHWHRLEHSDCLLKSSIFSLKPSILFLELVHGLGEPLVRATVSVAEL